MKKQKKVFIDVVTVRGDEAIDFFSYLEETCLLKVGERLFFDYFETQNVSEIIKEAPVREHGDFQYSETEVFRQKDLELPYPNYSWSKDQENLKGYFVVEVSEEAELFALTWVLPLEEYLSLGGETPTWVK